MSSIRFFLITMDFKLDAVNSILAQCSLYLEKNSGFDCHFHSFLRKIMVHTHVAY